MLLQNVKDSDQKVANIMNLTFLSYDLKVIDGIEAAQFERSSKNWHGSCVYKSLLILSDTLYKNT